MKKYQLKISVIGTVASGKTTVAKIIEDALAQHGIEVKVSDPNTDPDEVAVRDWKRTAKLVAKRTDVHMTTYQVRKTPPN